MQYNLNKFFINYCKYLQKIFTKNIIKKIKIKNYEIELYISVLDLKCVLDFLKNHTQMKFILVDIICYDRPFSKYRFILIYQLLSYTYNFRMKVVTQVQNNKDKLTRLDSIFSVFKSSVWPEREIWDLYGITFSNNPDLRRILTDYGFNGHPLRKDFPVSGFYELRYSEEHFNFAYTKVKLVQEERNLNNL